MNCDLDYSGLNNVFGAPGTGSLEGCMWCETEGK